MSVERSALSVERSAKAHSPIRELDYALLQQCIHCGMCLPTCPTYDATKVERNSPRGRIALMRAIADERLEPTRIFGEEMYFCLGCLACETACPAGVKYSQLFEAAREEAEAIRGAAEPETRRDSFANPEGTFHAAAVAQIRWTPAMALSCKRRAEFASASPR